MKRNGSTWLKVAAVALLLAAGGVALAWLDYLAWQVNHPSAPWWGYLLHK